ncbi:hypothetical protein [Bradyrhizobium sp. NP1]|uniref:hypothetical protein n=1 Tax=Bradyrhizobium sp. NP1 TaxID=3049772 RepID=UPI0025A640B2|nr:hypothetical protein [Bradyrhizobium sp. NP1]WJR81069.1 hypothetical protein QOU61_15340 [Bradyrhizobium sp. NP1]
MPRIFLAFLFMMFVYGLSAALAPPALAVNCDLNACLNACTKKCATASCGCSSWCLQSMEERKAKGLCKK